MTPVIFGLSGLTLTADEISFFKSVNPTGYILFQRNCGSPEQVASLTAALRKLSGRDDVPILIDQEGGRVSRLGPPLWPAFPAARRFGALYQLDPAAAVQAAVLNAQAIATMLIELGITVDCLPVADIPVAGAHEIIGDRAYGDSCDVVVALARATLSGLQAGGAIGIVKHIPGHGRAGADSHEALPIVDTPASELMATDFAAFAQLNEAPMAMTAHVLYTQLDSSACATLSQTIIQTVIREQIGFGGLLMSDDLSMKALGGNYTSRTIDALAAGCDVVLHCNGDMAQMQAIAEGLPSALSMDAEDRLHAALAWPKHLRDRPSFAALVAERDQLLA